ncbi:MAG: oxygenase MpaB family protein [Aeromicrobium sp.]
MTALTEEHALGLTLGPDSLTWRYASDPRAILAGGFVQLMHLTHPTVGAGVRDFSSYQEAPFARLQRTVDYINLLTYGGPDAVEVAQRVRDLHRPIRGKHPDGSHYSAFEPEAFTWVHATLILGLVTAVDQLIGPRLSEGNRERLYREQVGLGRLLGVREGALPETWTEFEEYCNHMVQTRLTYTDTALDYMEMLRRPPAPQSLPRSLGPLWPALRVPSGQLTLVVTHGLLPPVLRERLEVPWGVIRQAEFNATTASLRALTPVLPESVRVSGPKSLARRSGAIAHLPFAPTRRTSR